MEIATTKQRILQYIDCKGLSKLSFYERTGMKRGFLDGDKLHTSIPDTFIATIIATFPELNIEWLITGRGNMLKDEKLRQGSQCDEMPIAVAKETPQGGIPLVSMEVAAGFGSSDFAIREEDIQAHYIVPDFNGIDFMIRVKGSSMYPKYSSGDIVACRKLHDSKFIQWNKCYVIATKEQGLLVKRLKQSTTTEALLAVSDNKEYDPFEIPKEEITGIALVVGVIRLE